MDVHENANVLHSSGRIRTLANRVVLRRWLPSNASGGSSSRGSCQCVHLHAEKVENLNKMADFNMTSFDEYDELYLNYNLSIDDADFYDPIIYKDLQSLIDVCSKINFGLAVILGVVCILLLLTVFNKVVREDSQVWNFYQLLLLQIFVSLIINPIYLGNRNSIITNRNLCLFLHYSSDYIFSIIGLIVLVINIDVYLTSVLPVKIWQTRRFFRFVVILLGMWIFVCFFVAHVVISNNKAKTGRYCYSLDQSIHLARLVVQFLVPAGCCVIVSILIVCTHALKRFRRGSTSGEILTVRTIVNESEMQWIACIMVMDAIFIGRAILESILIFDYDIVYGKITRDRFVVFMIGHLFQTQSFFILPLCLFCIKSVRSALKENTFKVVKRASFGRLRPGDDTDDFGVHYGNNED